MLWEIDIHPNETPPDRAGQRIATAARELNLTNDLHVSTAHGFLLEGGQLDRPLEGDDLDRDTTALKVGACQVGILAGDA